jgi:hypothetical protein
LKIENEKLKIDPDGHRDHKQKIPMKSICFHWDFLFRFIHLKQPSNQATKQPSNQATKQPSNQATKQPSNQATK